MREFCTPRTLSSEVDVPAARKSHPHLTLGFFFHQASHRKLRAQIILYVRVFFYSESKQERDEGVKAA